MEHSGVPQHARGRRWLRVGGAILAAALVSCAGRPLPTWEGTAIGAGHATKVTTSLAATPAAGLTVSLAPSTAEGGERPTPCRLVDEGRISGQVLHAGGPAPEGTWVSLVFEGGPLQRVQVRDGRYALPLLARECPDGLHWVPFTLWAGGQGQAVRPDRADYRLDLDAPEPRGRPSDDLPECTLALGTLSGEVLSGGASVPDGTPVDARIGPGADSLAQTVLTAGGHYLLSTVGYRCGDEPARFLAVTLSVLGQTATFTPTGPSAVQDIAVR